MKWYETDGLLEHIARYPNRKALEKEASAASAYGWTQAPARVDPKGRFLVQFERSPLAEAKSRVSRSLAAFSGAQARLAARQDDLAGHLLAVNTAFEEAHANDCEQPVQLERHLLSALVGLTHARDAVANHRDVVLLALDQMDEAYAHARQVRARVPPPPVEIAETRSQLIRQADEDAARAAREEQLVAAQRKVVDAVRAWQETIGKRWVRAKRKQRAERALAGRDTNSTPTFAPFSVLHERWRQLVTASLRRHQQEHDALSSAALEQEQTLVQALTRRDAAFTSDVSSSPPAP